MKEDLMGNPCEQKETISLIRSDVTDVKTGFKDMVSEFRELSKELRASLIDGRELRVEVNTLKRDVDIAFKELRELDEREDDNHIETQKIIQKCRENDIQPLKEWRARIDDRFATLKVIPIICTIITLMITIYNILHRAAH